MAAVYGNVFLTGATGLLGSELLSQLLSNHEAKRIVCLVRDQVPNSRYYSESLQSRVVEVRGDLRDASLMTRILNEYDIDTVFHLAAQTLVGHANQSPVETLDVNIRGTWILLEAARQTRVKAFVFASSDKAYGNLNGQSYDETFALQGEHPYDVSKSCSDLIAQSYAKTYGLNVCVTRCGNFFGPGDLNESRIFPGTISSLKRGEAPVIRSDGKLIRDYIHVTDGAAAYRLLAKKMIEKPMPGEAFNFSYGLRLSVLEVVQTITRLMKSDLKPVVLNEAKHEIPVQSLNSSKAQKLLNWAPSLGFEEGVKQTIDWYLKHS